MINRKELKLKEITVSEYKQLRVGLELSVDRNQHNNRFGFCTITRPIYYPTLFDLVDAAASDSSVRDIRYRDLSGWHSITPPVCLHQKSEGVQPILETLSWFFLRFKVDLCYNQHNNHEISFDSVNGDFISTSLIIPGRSRQEYAWDGGNRTYFQIAGLLPSHTRRTYKKEADVSHSEVSAKLA